MRTFKEMFKNALVVAASQSTLPSEYWKIPGIVNECYKKYEAAAENIFYKKQEEAEEDIFNFVLGKLLDEKLPKEEIE